MNNYRPLPARYPSIKKNYHRYTLQQVQSLIEKNCGNVAVTERHGNGPNKTIILPEAKREMDVIISYGRRTPMNKLEQKYIGLGHIFDSGDGHHIIVVKHFIEIHTTNRSGVSAGNIGPNGETGALELLGYYREEYLENERHFNTDESGCLIDPFLKEAGPSEYVLEGHTHPNLGVFFSGPDRASGKARAATSPICIFVCDPIRKQMLGAVGFNLEPTEVIVYSRVHKKQQIEKPEQALPAVSKNREVQPARVLKVTQKARNTEEMMGALYGHLLNAPGYKVFWKEIPGIGGTSVTKIKIVRLRQRRRNKRRSSDDQS